MFNLDTMDNNFDGLDGILDFGTSGMFSVRSLIHNTISLTQHSNTGTGGDDDELPSLKEQLRKKESELEDLKFFLNDCDAGMKAQYEDDIASCEKEIEELKQKTQDKEKEEEEENSSN